MLHLRMSYCDKTAVKSRYSFHIIYKTQSNVVTKKEQKQSNLNVGNATHQCHALDSRAHVKG